MNNEADQMLCVIKRMSKKERIRTLLAFMIRDSLIIGSIHDLSDELRTLNVEEILSDIGDDFCKKNNIAN